MRKISFLPNLFYFVSSFSNLFAYRLFLLGGDASESFLSRFTARGGELSESRRVRRRGGESESLQSSEIVRLSISHAL